MFGNSGRLKALLRELGFEITETAIIIEGYTWFDVRFSYYTELTAIVDKHDNPLPFTLLEGSTIAKIPKQITKSFFKTRFKIAVQTKTNPKSFIRNHYAIFKKHYLDGRQPAFLKRSLDFFFDWKVYVQKIPLLKSKEEYIAHLCRNIIDYIIQRAGADKNKVYELLRNSLK